MRRTPSIAALLCAIAAAAFPGAANASRPAGAAEKHVITIAFNGGVDYPVRCVSVGIATVAKGWAAVRAIPTGSSTNAVWCRQNGFVFDGATFLHRSGRVWRIVLAGSSVPRARCAKVPLAVRRDLKGYTRKLGCS